MVIHINGNEQFFQTSRNRTNDIFRNIYTFSQYIILKKKVKKICARALPFLELLSLHFYHTDFYYYLS